MEETCCSLHVFDKVCRCLSLKVGLQMAMFSNSRTKIHPSDDVFVFFGMEMKPNGEEHKTFGSIPWNLFRMNWSKNEVNHHGCQPVSNEVGRCHVVEPIHINNMHKKNKLHDGNDVMIFFRHKKNKPGKERRLCLRLVRSYFFCTA